MPDTVAAGIIIGMDTVVTCIVSALAVIIPALVVYLKSWLEKATEERRKETEELRREVAKLQESNKTGMELIIDQTKRTATHGINDDDIVLKKEVEQELERLRTRVNATRVTLWSFHNGSYYSTGNPQRKLQTTFEALPGDREVPSEADILQNESVNGFLVVLHPMTAGTFQAAGGVEVAPGVRVFGTCESCKNAVNCAKPPQLRPRNCMLRCDIESMPFGSRFYRIMTQLGTKVWYGRFISDPDGNKMGVVTVQFDSCGKDADRFPEKSSMWCDTCVKVASAIHSMLQYV